MEDPIVASLNAQRQDEPSVQSLGKLEPFPNKQDHDRLQQPHSDSAPSSDILQPEPATVFSDLPLSALTATSSTVYPAPAALTTSSLNLQRPLSGNAASISTASSSTSASASPSSSPNVSRASSIGQSGGVKSSTGSARIRPGLLSRAGTDPDRDGITLLGNGHSNGINTNGIKPLSSISKGLPSTLFDAAGRTDQIRNFSSDAAGRRSAALRSTSASEDDEARLSDSGVIPKRFADRSSPLNSSVNVSTAASASTPSVNSAPAATASMSHPQRSTTVASIYSGYSASSSRNSSPLVSPANSISAARARQVFASPTSSPISSTDAGLPDSPAPNGQVPLSTSNSQFQTAQYYYPNEPISAGGHFSEASSSKSGSASLGRAQSVSSVSSINSTSSLEAAPFRAAPLGSFRVGFGGYGSRPLGGYGNSAPNNHTSSRRPQMMQRDKTLSGKHIEPNSGSSSSRAGMAIGTGGESSAADSEDGNDSSLSAAGERVDKPNLLSRSTRGADFQPKSKEREGLPSSSSPVIPFAFDSTAALKAETNNGTTQAVPPRKQAHTPKLPSDTWQYRNAPGMGGNRHNSSIPASWGLAAASGGVRSSHNRGSTSLSIPQSHTWSVGSSSGVDERAKPLDQGNEELLSAPSLASTGSPSPSKKHHNPSTLKSKLVKSASKLGIKPLAASAASGSGGSSPSGAGSRPFLQLEGEIIPEDSTLRIDTAPVPPVVTSGGGAGGLLVPSIAGTPLSAGAASSHSGDSAIGLAGLVGVIPSINAQDDSLPMTRTSSVTNAPLFVAKHGEASGPGSGMNFNAGAPSPLPSPGIPAFVNTSKNAFGVWAFGVPEPRVSPKEERAQVMPIPSPSSNLSASPAALRAAGALSPSSLAAIPPSSPLRTPSSALSPSPLTSLDSRAGDNHTPPLPAAAHPSPETPATPLSKMNALSSGVTSISSKQQSTLLTPAQQVRAEVEAGTARAPSEPSGHTPGPTPVLPPGASSSRDRRGRNRSSQRERERGASRDAQDQMQQSSHLPSHARLGSSPPMDLSTTKPNLSTATPQPLSKDAPKIRERQRTNSSGLKIVSIPYDPNALRKRESTTSFSASAPASPLLHASRFNSHKHSSSTSSGGSQATDDSTAATSRGRMTIPKESISTVNKPPQRPSFLRALTSESVFSSKSAGAKSFRSRNDSVLSGEGSWGSGSTSKPAGRREEDVKSSSALGRESRREEDEEAERDEDADETTQERQTKEQSPGNASAILSKGTVPAVEPDRKSFNEELSVADSLIAERRAPVIDNSINMPAYDLPTNLDSALQTDLPDSAEGRPPATTASSPATALSSPDDSLPSGSKSADKPHIPAAFGASEVQARSEAETGTQTQPNPSSSQTESRLSPPLFTRADTTFSAVSNALSTTSGSIAPVSMKAPVRKIPGVYIPHADSSQIGNSPGRTHPPQEATNGASMPGGTSPSESASSSSSASSNPALSPPVLATPATPASLLAPSAQSPITQSPATPVSPRTARGPKDFEFGEILGEGSYSTVLEAWDLLSGPSTTSDGSTAIQTTTAAAAAAGKTPSPSATAARAGRKMYAIKVLDKMHILKEKKQKYVNVEREALSLLVKHPGVISLYWTFQDRESLYFVLQLAQNGELLTFIKRHGSFDLSSSKYYAAQLIDTIGAMHRVGVIHRDIKPENVLLDGAMRIKVTDFGSAKISKMKPSISPAIAASSTTSQDPVSGKERANSFVGTAEYVSPELLGGKAAAEASDFWAFGCVLYQMIAGRPPFKGANEYQTFQKIIKREFEFPEEFPSNARDLVDRLLVLDPEKRLGFKGGAEEIEKHVFFSEIDFDTIWSIPAPIISTGIYTRPAPSITNRGHSNSLFGSDSWVDSREAGSLLSKRDSSIALSANNAGIDSRAPSVSSEEQGSSSAAPARSTTSVADADDSDSDAQAGPRRPRGLSTGEAGASGGNGKKASNLLRLATAVTGKEWSATVGTKSNRNHHRASIIPPNVRQQLKHRFSSSEVNGSSSSVDDFDQDEISPRGASARRRNGSAMASPATSTSLANRPSMNLTPVVGWAGLLLPHEVLLYACPVIHRKTGTANMFSKRRQLILTDFPRLLCVKETSDALKVKSEVILAMPQLVPSASQTSDMLAPLPTAGPTPDIFLSQSPTQTTPTRLEAKRRASHSAGIDDQQSNSNVLPVSVRGLPTRRESWSANSLIVERGQATPARGSTPDSDAARARALLRANANAAPNMLIGVEARGNRAFVVHTVSPEELKPARSYLYEDPSGDSNNWIKVINSARGG